MSQALVCHFETPATEALIHLCFADQTPKLRELKYLAQAAMLEWCLALKAKAVHLFNQFVSGLTSAMDFVRFFCSL